MLNEIAPPKATTTSSIKNVNEVSGTFDVVVSDFDAPRGLQSINVDVWASANAATKKNYVATKQSDGSYKATVSVKNHNTTYGEYSSQVNITQNDKVTTPTQLLKTNMRNMTTTSKTQILNVNQDKGTFDIVVSELSVPAGMKALQVAVWGEPSGQNDLKWYNLTKQSNGTYKVTVNIKDHKFEQGKYNAHTYVTLNNNTKVNTNAQSVTIKQGTPTSKVAFSSVNGKNGTFDIVISDIKTPVGMKSIQVGVWGDPGGQNDLKWYTPVKQKNGTYKISINKKNHKNEQGNYNAHVYITQTNGIKSYSGKANAVVKQPTATAKTTISSVTQNNGTFDVVVSGINAPMGLKIVQVAVWGNPSGQNDIKWYTASRQKNGTYKVSVNKKNHKNEQGVYNAHTYITQNNGVKNYASASTVNLVVPKPKGNLAITNVNKKNGTFDVVVTGVSAPKGLRAVELPTWGSKNGQNDIKWYKGTKQKNGSYKITVNSKNHKNEKGTYNIHLYIMQNDGKRVYISAKTTSL